MVDVVRSVAATRAIQAPAAVDVTDAQDATVARPLLCFEIGYSLAGILSDLLPPFEGDVCEAPLSVNSGSPDGEAVREFHHADCSRSEESAPSA